MIIKNEEQTIARCLDSVKDIVDEIIIVDTGSKDMTKEIVKNTLLKFMNLNGLITFQLLEILPFLKLPKNIYFGWMQMT